MELNIDTITFGRYKNKILKEMLKDRKYCRWFLSEPEFKIKYEYIYNKVKNTYIIIHRFSMNLLYEVKNSLYHT